MFAFRCITLLASTCAVIAQEFTSLYIPGSSNSGEQALSADFVAVGSDGRTTWAMQAPSGAPEDESFAGTATYIEASDYVSFGLAVDDVTATVTYEVACTISASVALCSAGANGEMDPEVITETVSKYAIQLGSAPAPTPAPGASTGESSGSASLTAVNSSRASSGTGLTTVKSSQASSTSPPESTSSASSAPGRWEVPLCTMFIASIFTGALLRW